MDKDNLRYKLTNKHTGTLTTINQNEICLADSYCYCNNILFESVGHLRLILVQIKRFKKL